MLHKSFLAIALALACATSSMVAAVPVDVNGVGLQGPSPSLVFLGSRSPSNLARVPTTQAKTRRDEEFLQGTVYCSPIGTVSNVVGSSSGQQD